MSIVNIEIKRSHYGATVDEVCEAFNVGNGQSTLLGMAVSPRYRPTVEQYRDAVTWKLDNTEGEALEKWRSVAHHLDLVLNASKRIHDYKAQAAASQRTA